jgi:excisionase family DNA binding protein
LKKNGYRKLLTVAEVAEKIGLARQTVYNQMSQGLFPVKHKKIGRLVRFDSSEIEKYIDKLPDHR